MGWDGKTLDLDETGSAVLTLGPDAADVLASIGFSLYYVDADNDLMLLLGTDNDMNADWGNRRVLRQFPRRLGRAGRQPCIHGAEL